ncbi:MAG: hypothetical protein PHS32_06915 [Rhodoferax sp.]|uniref:hypothetical protein n=1 Tax=Rhodoferax sp. TaxID=50421 RepID=UPI00261728FC|nr:hypothetical protein [Rhodoferax sp.]MDD5333460.1 hypothetical protein [Rhodoferax sp.]
MKRIVTPLVLGPVIALIALSGRAQPVAPAKKFDLKVQIVVETTPMVYGPLNVPAGTVVSAPPSPPSIINCPMTPGAALATSGDCSEIGLPSNTNIKLLASANLPNAHFHQWKDIPNMLGVTVSTSCSSPMAPSITCSMAGSRAIQAIYKCNDPYHFNPKTQNCEGAGKNKYADDFTQLNTKLDARAATPVAGGSTESGITTTLNTVAASGTATKTAVDDSKAHQSTAVKSQVTALQTAVAGLPNTASITALQTDLTVASITALATQTTNADARAKPPNIDTPGIGEFVPPFDGWLKVDRPLQIGAAVIYKSKKGVVSIANGITQIAWGDGSTSRIARTLEEVSRAAK